MSLNVSGLTVARGGRAILADLSFSAPAGAVTGLIGANGAGKSTVLHALLGLVPGTGSVRFGADDLPAMPRRDRARLAALVEQSATTEERVSVRDVVALGRIPFQSALSAAPGAQDQAVVDAALTEAGVDTFSTRLFHTLSGGEQQRVHLARALAQQPRLLLLDEPTSHLDIGAQLDLLAILRRRAEAGTTVLVALHDLNLAARACDHLVLIKEGRLVAAGSPQTVLTPANLRAAYGVDARLVPDPLTGRTLIVYDASAPSIPD